MENLIDAHLSLTIVLHHNQQTEHNICILWVDELERKEGSLEKKCKALQKKLEKLKRR